MKKSGIVILEENIQSLRKLSTEDLGVLMRAVLDTVSGEEPDHSQFSFPVELLYPIIQGSVDRMRETSERRSAAGVAGNDKRWSHTESQCESQSESPEPNRTEPNHTEPINTEPNHTDERKTPSGSKESAVDAVPEFRQDFVREAWGSYTKMRRKIKKPMTEEAERLAVKKLKDLSRGDPIRAVKILEQSVFNGWQGLFDLKSEKQKTTDWSAV